jgi:hypothetical protein
MEGVQVGVGETVGLAVKVSVIVMVGLIVKVSEMVGVTEGVSVGVDVGPAVNVLVGNTGNAGTAKSEDLGSCGLLRPVGASSQNKKPP